MRVFMCDRKMKTPLIQKLLFLPTLFFLNTLLLGKLPTPPEVWQDYDADAGEFKEEIIFEQSANGIYEKHFYISAYINGTEVRVYCKYAVKAGIKNAPGLLNVHGWMGRPAIDKGFVEDGWAVLAHDYSGINTRSNYTKYPLALAHGAYGGKENGSFPDL